MADVVKRVNQNQPYQVPTVGERVWSAFLELDPNRSVAVGMTVFYQPIQHSEILAYQKLTGIVFKDWERRAIVKMDGVRREYLNQRDGDDAPEVSSRNLTPDLFDALFGR